MILVFNTGNTLITIIFVSAIFFIKLKIILTFLRDTIFCCSRAILELHRSQGLHDLGSIKWDMALCLFAVYVICYFSLWKGISTSGKVVWFTALFPYAVLLILLVRGITLPGSAEGIKYYLNPNFNAITSAEVPKHYRIFHVKCFIAQSD